MKQFFLTILMVIHLDGFAQIDTLHYNFNNKVMEVEGDLNKDNLADKVVVTQDT